MPYPKVVLANLSGLCTHVLVPELVGVTEAHVLRVTQVAMTHVLTHVVGSSVMSSVPLEMIEANVLVLFVPQSTPVLGLLVQDKLFRIDIVQIPLERLAL